MAAELVGCGGGPAVVPATFTTYNSKDGAFACDAPEGWEITGGGKRGPVWAKFVSGSAMVKINASAAGSLMADAMGGRTADMTAEAPEEAPVHQIHVLKQEAAEDEFPGYAELRAPATLDCELGPARVSEFTSGGRHGYRATIIAHEKGVDVICLCNESQWTAAQPAFDQILASLERGVPEL